MNHSSSIGTKLQMRNLGQKYASTYELNRDAAKSAATRGLQSTASKTKKSAGMPSAGMHSQTNFHAGVSTPKLVPESLASIASVQRQSFDRLPSGRAVSSCAE